jgi:AcrR family transcriptional regulator
VAKEAGVSLPTVYRLFPNKTALAKAARLEVRDRLGIDPSPTSSLDELIRRQATHVHNAAQMDEAFLKALFELSAQPLSEAAADAARQAAADALKTELQGVRGKEREYLLNAVSMFFSSAGAVMLWRYRLMNDEGTETFAWVIRTLVDAVKKKAQG